MSARVLRGRAVRHPPMGGSDEIAAPQAYPGGREEQPDPAEHHEQRDDRGEQVVVLPGLAERADVDDPRGAPCVGPKRPTSGRSPNSAGSSTKPRNSTPTIATTWLRMTAPTPTPSAPTSAAT